MMLRLASAVFALALGCKQGADPSSAPAPTPPPAPSPVAPAAAQPTGPRAELTDARFRVVAALTAGDASRFSLELRGSGGYHVNDQYPIAVDLTVENATVEKTALRRADAAELTQSVARFDVAVRSTAPHPTVRGRMRFAVCTEAQCAFETREFAVAL